MKKKIAVLAGDGIGPEVMEQALRVLSCVAINFGHRFEPIEVLVGGAAFEKYASHLPEETVEVCQNSDAILFGSVGGPISEMHAPKWHNCEANSILALRKTFQFNINFRPVRVFPQLAYLCPLKRELIEKGVDILFVRELLGDCYFGEHKTGKLEGRRIATDLSVYSEDQIASVAHAAFRAAEARRGHVTSVDKANVLDTSRLWREVVHEVAHLYPEVLLQDMLVDNCAMQLLANPAQFDVILTTNMFGDILSDAAAVLPGSLGLMASASLNNKGFGLYEPPGGSAPDIAGAGTANPIGQILSVALMLRFSFGLEREAQAIEAAVQTALNSGLRTRDIYSDFQSSSINEVEFWPEESQTLVNTSEMTEQILSCIEASAKAALVRAP